MRRPNIVLITLHDLGRHLRCYDAAVPATPNIERIGAEGVVFENHFSAAPLCSPARASIQTGRYPHCNGMDGLAHAGWFALHAGEKCLPQYLNELGHHTALFGFQHEAWKDLARLGYTEVHSDPAFPPAFPVKAPEVVPHAIRFLEHPPATPFFLSLGFLEVHRPFKYEYLRPVDPSSLTVPPHLLDCPEVRSDLADFYGMLLAADDAVGTFLESLDRTGLSEETLLIFTTDHGAAFPRAKSTLYDPGIGVALLARWPGRIQAGSRVSAMTSHVDLLPTILEIAGGTPSGNVQGQSFAGLLRPNGTGGRQFVFAEKTWHDWHDPMRCVRTERFKYIRNFSEGFLYENPFDAAMCPSYRAMERSRRKRRPMVELYDLQADPNEMNNLVGQSSTAEVESGLQETLMEWMRSTDDRLLDGPSPIQASAKGDK